MVKRYDRTGCDDLRGVFVKHSDYAALEAKCAALAAEKEKFAVECAATKIAIAYLKSGRHDFTLNTPATDAFLAEVRASAVDEACLKISNAIVNCYQDEQIGLDAAATICGDFAAQLRKGVQS